jgi:phosphomannomutase
VPWNQIGRLDLYDSALQMYADALKEFLDVDAIRAQQYKIVLDCCNGTASHFVESLFTEMGCEVVAINNEPSPDAKYEPLPEEKNTQAVCQIVKPLGADVGFYFNIDATSLVVISDQGVSLGEEYTFGLLTEYILSQHPGKAIVTNVSTTGLIDDLGRKYNATVSRCPIGQRYVIERMRSISAVFGGEGSGGAAYPQFLYAFDGILSMGLVLQMLAHRQTRVSEIVQSFPKYLIKKGFINCPVYLFHSVLARVMEQFADQELDLTDGVKVFLDDGWLHIRPSRNEAIIRVIAESRDADDVEQLLHLGKTEVRKAMVST